MPESFNVKFSFSGFIVLKNKIFKWPHPICTFCDYLPFEEDLSLYLNKREFPSPKDNMYQVLLILTRYIWRKILKIVSVSLLFCYYLPLEKGIPLHLTNLNVLPQGWFVQSLVKIGPVVLEKIFKRVHTLILQFCDYFPFEKDLALYLNHRHLYRLVALYNL
jgi:hypothetical protein